MCPTKGDFCHLGWALQGVTPVWVVFSSGNNERLELSGQDVNSLGWVVCLSCASMHYNAKS